MRRRRWLSGFAGLTGALLLNLATSPACAASPEANSPSIPEPAPPSDDFHLRLDESERLTIPVQLDGGAQLQFLIDTGAERTGVAKERAKEMTLASLGTRSIIGFGGQQDVPSVLIPDLSFGKSSRANVEALTFSQSVIGADGFLGIDSLDKLKVDFDFLHRRVSLKRASMVGERGGTNSVVVRADRDRHGRLIFSGAKVNGVKADVMLDTGSSVTIGNEVLRQRLLDVGRLNQFMPVYVKTLTGKIMRADYCMVDRLLIDGVLVRNLPIAFVNVAPFRELRMENRPALFLGMDALRVFEKVSVDFRHHTVRFFARTDNRSTNLVSDQALGW